MPSLRRAVHGATHGVVLFWRKTPFYDPYYRKLMTRRCPHPEHRRLALVDHGQPFDYCLDCKTAIEVHSTRQP